MCMENNGNGNGDHKDFGPSSDLQKLAKMHESALQSAKEAAAAPPRIVESRCHVCTHPNRDWIEYQIIKGHSYLSIENSTAHLPPEHRVGRRSVSTHAKGHMTIQEAAYRAILEQEASLEAQNFEEGVKGAITKRGVLEILVRKGFQDVLDDIAHVEPRDLIQIIKLAQDMDEKSAAVQIEEYKNQVAILTESIQNVVPPAIQGEIVAEVRRLRKRQGVGAEYESIVGVPALVQDVEVTDS
jgi:hypothetical protein